MGQSKAGGEGFRARNSGSVGVWPWLEGGGGSIRAGPEVETRGRGMGVG